MFPVHSIRPADSALPHLPVGGRCFAWSGGWLVAADGEPGDHRLLVPRGHGAPLVARRVGSQLRAEPRGEVCAPVRWHDAGALAMVVVEPELPAGPRPAALAEGAGSGEAWLAVRLVNLAWSAARLADPSLGRGVVAVGRRWVTGVSPEARALGIRRGMSFARAARLGRRVRTAPPGDAAALRAAVTAWAAERWGAAPRGRLLLLRIPAGDLASHTRLAAGVASELWQRFGVECAAAAASAPEAAEAATRWLGPRQCAAVAAAGAHFVRARRAEPAPGMPRPTPRPDVEGMLELVLAARPSAGGRVRVRLVLERGVREAECGLHRAAVEAALRPALVGMGTLHAVTVRRVGGEARRSAPTAPPSAPSAPRQLALLPGLR